MFPARASIWCITKAITAMSAEANGKNKTRMNGYPVSWNRIKDSKEYRKNWARHIQKIYTCPPVFVAED
jgi:hypothetical protein